MTIDEIEQKIRIAITNLIGEQYPEFHTHLPLSVKKGICVSLKNAVLGNTFGIGTVYTITMRSDEHDMLRKHAALLREKITEEFSEHIIAEIPEQDFFIEGVKGSFRWIWETGFDMIITSTQVKK